MASVMAVRFGSERRHGGGSCRLVGAGEFVEVMDGADEAPFALDLFEASEQELAEASGLLDLPEHRLDDLFAQAIARAPAGTFEFLRHGGHQGLVFAISLT